MGVIKKNTHKVGVFAAESDDSLHIPQDEDDVNSINSLASEVFAPLETPTQHRQRKRLQAIPTAFSNTTKRFGRKKNRRYENGRQLETLVEDEEFQEITIHDFISSHCSPFTRLLNAEENHKLLEDFMNEKDEHYQILSSRRHTKQKKMALEQVDFDRNGKSAFQNIKSRLRRKLKKCHIPLGMIEYLENEVLEFFTNSPEKIYISGPLTSFQRLLLHAVAQYHNLKSISIDSTNHRLVRVSNPFSAFQQTTISLGRFLNNKKNTVYFDIPYCARTF